MAIVTRAFSEVDGEIAEASSVNRVIDDLYTLINGGLDSANVATSGIDTSNVNNLSILLEKIDYGILVATQEVF